MKRLSMLCAAAILGVGTSGTALAQYDYRYDNRYDNRYDSRDYRYDDRDYRYDDRYDNRYADDRYHDDRYRDGGYDRYPAPAAVQYDWGQVVRVDPIITADYEPIRRTECWSQPTVYREPVRYRHYSGGDRAPAILGAIVGGVIGNQFGSGRGRDAATLAGAALGYSATRDATRHGGYYVSGGRAHRVYEQRCAPRTSYVRDDRVQGYEVTYRYRGQIYRTTTDYHPGDRIQIRVDVTPLP